MLIQGFENAPIVAGEELLALPGFWAAYLMWLSQTEEHDASLYPFGVDGADADAACDALGDEEHWPVFRIPFDDGHTALVLGRNFPDDPETEYFITHPEWGRHGHLATVSGHQAAPACRGGSSNTSPARLTSTLRESTPNMHVCFSYCLPSATRIYPRTPQPWSVAR